LGGRAVFVLGAVRSPNPETQEALIQRYNAFVGIDLLTEFLASRTIMR